MFLKNTALKDVFVYTDYDLIDMLLKDGDSKWFGILYDRYASKVYNKCLMLLRDKDSAKDLTHDIFIKAFLHIGNFKKDSSFYTWLYTIVYNTCIDHLKKSNKYKMVPADIELKKFVEEEVEDQEILNMECERLKILMEKIATDDKLILIMKYQDKMKIQDISQILNISNSAVKMRINRAKKKVLELYNLTYRHSTYYLNR